MDRLARTNPDGLDAFVVLSPFEMWASYTPPGPSRRRPEDGRRGVRPDPVPVPERDDTSTPILMRHYHVLETLTRYDALLAISDATRHDCLSVLRLAREPRREHQRRERPARSSSPTGRSPRPPRCARPSPARDRPAVRPQRRRARRAEEHLEVDRRLRRACPIALRDEHQLVLTFAINDWGREAVRDHVRHVGVGGLGRRHRRGQRRGPAAALPALRGVRLPVALRRVRACRSWRRCTAARPVIGGEQLVAGRGRRRRRPARRRRRRARHLGQARRRARPTRAGPDRSATRAVKQARGFSWERTADTRARRDHRRRRPAPPARRLRFDRGHARKPNDRLLLAPAAPQVGRLRLLGLPARRAPRDVPDRPLPRRRLRARAGPGVAPIT